MDILLATIFTRSGSLRESYSNFGAIRTASKMTRDIQIGLYGRPLDATRAGDPVDRRVFPYPAYADLLFWPAAQVPFPAIRIVVLVALFALTVATPLLWLRAWIGAWRRVGWV